MVYKRNVAADGIRRETDTMLEDIKNAVKKFGETAHGTQWYFIIHKEFVDGIYRWLNGYTNTPDGDWLGYNIQQSQNEEQMYILILYPSW